MQHGRIGGETGCGRFPQQIQQKGRGKEHESRTQRGSASEVVKAVPCSAAEQMPAQYDDGHIDRSQREHEHALYSSSDAHAGKNVGAPGQKADDDQRRQTACMRDDLSCGGRHAHPEKIGNSPTVPAPWSEGRAAEQTVMSGKSQIAAQPEYGTGKGRPCDACGAESRKSEISETEAEIADEVCKHHDKEREQRQKYLPVGTENGVHHDEHVIERQLTAVGLEKGRQRRTKPVGNAHDMEKQRSEHESRCRYDAACDGGEHENESGVAVGSFFQTGAERLAYRGQTAAGDEGGQKHEQSKDLCHHACGGLRFRTQSSGCPDIGHGNDQMTEHESRLRQSKTKEFLSGRQRRLS